MFGSKIIQPTQQNMIQGGGGGGGGGGMLSQMAGMGLKTALAGSPLAPLSGVLGGLFNNGGRVGYNTGGMAQGPLANPHGYNEGGQAGETPIKKVMDEQKLEQQAVAFERDQQRKQEAHDMAMKQKQSAFSEAQKMKKESATTKMKPKSPSGPLAAGKK